MTVWIFDENLLWSTRLQKGVESMGLESIVSTNLPDQSESAGIAIVNLGSKKCPPETFIPALRERGDYVIAHAGHKEKELLDLAKQFQVNHVVTNGELTHKLPQIIKSAMGNLES